MVKTEYQTDKRAERPSLEDEAAQDLRAPVDVPESPRAESPEASVIGRIRSRRRSAQLRSCPRCFEPSLVPTGVYWACAKCRYAITEQALLLDLLGAPTESDRPSVAPAARKVHR